MDKPVGFKIKRLANLISRRLCNNPVIKETDNLTGMHGWMIEYVYRHGGVCQRDIEKNFNIRSSTVTKMLQLMEKNGLVERMTVEDDARKKVITLTEKALEIHANVEKQIEIMEKVLCAGISAEDMAAFNSVLEKMQQNIGEDGGGDCKC